MIVLDHESSSFFSYMVIRSTKQTARQIGIPGQTIALFLMTSETQIGATLSINICGQQNKCIYFRCTVRRQCSVCTASDLRTWLGGMLGVVKHKHV